ncbi:MAG: zinc-ribbon domain-containing protein, partial [Eubacterium sp.]|nr:zinc-ribbon domain-containing protein [Eubacterium sp.]
MNFCKECGQQIEDNAKFCQHCGASIEAEVTAVSVSDGSKSSSKISFIIGICGGLGAVLFLVLVLFVLGVVRFGG